MKFEVWSDAQQNAVLVEKLNPDEASALKDQGFGLLHSIEADDIVKAQDLFVGWAKTLTPDLKVSHVDFGRMKQEN